jgi:TolB protein
MLYKFVVALFNAIILCSGLVSAQTGLSQFQNRATFESALTNQTKIDFEGVVSNSSFRNYKMPGGLTTSGISFQTTGGGRFGPGYIGVSGARYNAGPIYETTSGAKLTWAPPNQPGDASLQMTLPAGITAVGADIWTAQPYISSVQVVVTTTDAKTQEVTVSTPQRPAGAFIGFTSDTPISSLRFSIPKGQVALILDNITIGRSAKGSQPSSFSGNGRTPRDETPASRPAASQTAQTVTSLPYQSVAPKNADRHARPTTSGSGTIAYVRGGTEIRLIEPDGTNDRRLWTHPDARKELGIHGVAWRPDGKELAFSSSHAAAVSLFDTDLYAIRPDGSGFRKLTNAPDHSELARYPKGSVSVTFRNDQPIYQQSQASAGIFIVYVAGAAEPQQILLPPGATKTVVFNQVADFGNKAQAVVAIWGNYRWFTSGVDVRAGSTVKAPTFSIVGDGIKAFGAFRPIWRSDGSLVSYRSGACTLVSVPANPIPGEFVYSPLFGGTNPLGTCVWDWGPTTALANQIIYTENARESAIYQITERGAHPGAKLTTFSDVEYQLLLDLHWVPDGSGFLFSNQTLERDSANIFRYDFASRNVTQVTHLENEFTGRFSISPDGQSVVFERSTSLEEDTDSDLWIVPISGGEPRLLVRHASEPSWR